MTEIKIKRNRDHVVVAHIAEESAGVRLLRLTADTGPVPDQSHLINALFRNKAALQRAVLAAMSGPVGDTLDRVLLTHAVDERWEALATEFVRRLPSGINPDAIPDERARPISGGRLLIWVDLPDGERISMIVERGEWAWRTREH